MITFQLSGLEQTINIVAGGVLIGFEKATVWQRSVASARILREHLKVKIHRKPS